MINRPIEVSQDSFKRDHQLLWDLLWSDPVQSDEILTRNKMGYDVKNPVKFGQERLKAFLVENGLSMLIRSHECVNDGFERLWGGTLMTLFSATDYNEKFKNAAVVVVIKKNSEIIPKVIYPMQNTGQIGSFAGNDDGKFGSKTYGAIGMGSNSLNGMSVTMGHGSNWIDNERRPATPPRYGKGSFKKP